MRGANRLQGRDIGPKGIAGAVIQTLATNILIQVLNIATGILSARMLAPQGRGELAAMIMWPQFLATVFTFGLPAALIYQTRVGRERLEAFLGAALLLSAFSGLIAAGIGVAAMPYLLHGYAGNVVIFARFAMLAAPLSSIGWILYSSAQAVEEFGRFNKFRMLPSCVVLCVLLMLAGLHWMTPRTAALAYLLAGLPAVLWNTAWALSRFALRFENIAGCAKSLLGYGIRAWGMDFIGAISDQVDRVLVVAFLSPHDMGLYVVAQSSARLFTIVPGALSSVITPKIVALGPKDGAPLLVRAARIAFVAMSAGAIPLGIMAPYALGLVYGHRFMAAAPVFRVLLAEAVLAGFTWLLAQGFSSLGKPGRASIQQFIGLSVALPLLLVLVPRFGIDGACYALLGSTTLRTIFAVLNYRLLYQQNLAHFVPRFSDIHWVVSRISLS